MKNKILITVFLIALFIVLVPQNAHAATEGDFTFTIDIDFDGQPYCSIINYTGTGGDIVIPNTLGGIDVTIIQSGAFNGRGITSVILPNTLEIIKSEAFSQNYITSLTIPDSVTHINANAFAQNRIETLTLGNKVKSIGSYAFLSNRLYAVTLPDSILFVDFQAFALNNVFHIDLPGPPDGYTSEWRGLTPGTVTAITNHADDYWRTVPTPIVYNITYTNIDGSDNSSNPDTYTVEDLPLTLQNPTRDGRDFIEWSPEDTITAGSTGNKTFTAVWSPYFYVSYIPGTCTIKDYFGAGGDINIPDTLGGLTVTAIGNSAFENLNNVNVTIPSSVISVNNLGFNGCSFTGITLNEGLISVGEGAFNGLPTSDIGTLTLPNSLTTIKRNAFMQAGISDIVFGSGLTTIGENAFSFNKLTSLNFPSDIASIPNSCFSENSISTLNLPSTVQTIGNSAFTNNELANITIPDSVTTIGEHAFMNNPIASLTLGNSIQDIQINAFWTSDVCTLSSVILPDSLTHIGASAFDVPSLVSGSIALPQPPNGYRRDWKDSSNNVYTTIEGVTFSKELTRDPANTPIDYTITYNLDGGTNHASNPSTYTVEDAEITLQDPTRDGYNFIGWQEGATIPTGSTGNKTFTASWEIVKHNVTPTTNVGGTASPSTVQQVSHGGNIIFTLTPDEGYWLSSVDIISGHCTTLDRSTPTISRFEFENITSDTEISFYFEKKQYTVNVASTSGGSATPATATIEHGDDLVISPTSDIGYHISSVTTNKGNEVVDNHNGTYTIKNIKDDTTVNVEFELNIYNITINLNSNASISPFGIQKVRHGEELAITITPKEGYRYNRVDITGTNNKAVSDNSDGSHTLTLTNVRDDNEVTFSITKKQYNINIVSSAGGSTTPAIAIMEHGDDLVISPTPDIGYHTASVTTDKGNEVVDNNNGTYTIKNITDATTANVTFEPIPVTSLTLTDDVLEMNVGVTSALNTTFPYTILPLDAANKAVRYSSTNPEVAEVNNTTGMIITKKQGITQIYAISEQNGTIYDSLTLTVKDAAPAPIPPETHTANIKGRLIDDSGNPLAGYPVTLCSDPQTTVTDANGYFQFIGIPFTSHTLIINRPDITEAGRFSLNIMEGSSTSSSVAGNDIDITFTGNTEDIDITLTQSVGINFEPVVKFTQKAKPVYDPSMKVENPNTGDWD